MFKLAKKLALFAMCIITITANASTAALVLPPKYLSVKNFDQCLGTKNMGSWTAWCMPAVKPDTCPNESWQQLDSLTGRDRVQDC